jgi:hypothetical protein
MATILDSLRLFEAEERFWRMCYALIPKAAVKTGKATPFAAPALPEKPRDLQKFAVRPDGRPLSYEGVRKIFPPPKNGTVLSFFGDTGRSAVRASSYEGARKISPRAEDALNGRRLRPESRGNIINGTRAAVVFERMAERRQERPPVAEPQALPSARDISAEGFSFSPGRTVELSGGDAPLLRTQYIFDGGQPPVSERESPAFAAPPVPAVDYDTIYRHVEMRLGEAIVCSREGV